MSNLPPLRTPRPKPRTRTNPGPLGATPTRPGNHYRSSTSIGYTQQDIKSSLWARILYNQPDLVRHLIKPDLVDNDLVAAIERDMADNMQLKAARDLLFENEVPEKLMYTPMVDLLRHISTFSVQSSDGASSSASDTTIVPSATPNIDPTQPASAAPSTSSDIAAPSHPSSPAASQRDLAPAHDPEPLGFPDDGENHGLCINRTWVDTHAALLRTDHGLYISVRGIEDADEPDGKRGRAATVTRTHSKVARTALQMDAATVSHTASESQDESIPVGGDIQGPVIGVTTTPPVDAAFTSEVDNSLGEEGLEDERPKETTMEDRKPDISLIDLPHSGVDPPECLWRQCAVFMEIKKNARDGPLGNDSINAVLPEGAHLFGSYPPPRCNSTVTQMADHARILMAARPFLRFCLHVLFSGTNFNVALFDRDGAIISRSYDIRIHFGLFIRIIRRLSCEMNAYDLGLDTTVRPESCLGSVCFPSYLVKISSETWYRTEGVPLWQSTSLLGRGTFVFYAREYKKSNGPLQILKNAWREEGRLKESEVYQLMQNSGGPFRSPKALATFVVGRDVPLDDTRMVTIQAHRARFGSIVTGKGATIHRLILASRGKSLASYSSLEQLLIAALGIVIAHKVLYDQGILHGDLSYGNTFLSDSGEDHIYGFLADLDLASIDDTVLDNLPEGAASFLKQQREKGPRSGTIIFMAVELLRSQVRHLKDEKGERRKGREGPPTLNTKREAYHDLESLLWVLVYAMMIHNYNAIPHEADKKEYKEIIDENFGHGCAKTIIKNRQALYLAHSRVGEDCVSQWFPDVHEQKFFIRSMTLIAEHDRKEEEKADCGTFKGEINDDNPALWYHLRSRLEKSPDEDAEDKSGTYKGKVGRKPVAGSRKSPPVITYESVVAILTKTIDELQ